MLLWRIVVKCLQKLTSVIVTDVFVCQLAVMSLKDKSCSVLNWAMRHGLLTTVTK